ncbi:MAG: hypothetical protein AAF581_07015 [Planctomycetota bacterium]
MPTSIFTLAQADEAATGAILAFMVLYVLFALGCFVFWILMMVNAVRTSQTVWAVFIFFFPIVGIIYLFVGYQKVGKVQSNLRSAGGVGSRRTTGRGRVSTRGSSRRGGAPVRGRGRAGSGRRVPTPRNAAPPPEDDWDEEEWDEIEPEDQQPRLRAVAAGNYFIQTKSGQKGPFSVEQLIEFVEADKIPLTLDVIAEDSGLAFSVSDLVE